MTLFQTQLLPAQSAAFAAAPAVELLAAGEVVALPTETVYGLAADALRSEAVLKIFEAKERPFFDPLIVHLPDLEWLERLTLNRPALVQKLALHFWPGPLTLVLPRREIIPDVVTSGLSTVAIRMSAHPVFATIASLLGRPLAAPSANRFGRISPTCAQDVMSELAGRIPLVVDGGPTLHGLESTILAVEGERIRILRSGPITPEELAEFGPVEFGIAGSSPDAPGQLKSHYAPRTPLQLLPVEPSLLQGKKTGYLGWTSAPAGFAQSRVLSPAGDLREAAATLFSKMRQLDEAGLDLIVAEPVPSIGLGIAIMDRLGKAAAQG